MMSPNVSLMPTLAVMLQIQHCCLQQILSENAKLLDAPVFPGTVLDLT